jgi:hypothetical protein
MLACGPPTPKEPDAAETARFAHPGPASLQTGSLQSRARLARSGIRAQAELAVVVRVEVEHVVPTDGGIRKPVKRVP